MITIKDIIIEGIYNEILKEEMKSLTVDLSVFIYKDSIAILDFNKTDFIIGGVNLKQDRLNPECHYPTIIYSERGYGHLLYKLAMQKYKWICPTQGMDVSKLAKLSWKRLYNDNTIIKEPLDMPFYIQYGRKYEHKEKYLKCKYTTTNKIDISKNIDKCNEYVSEHKINENDLYNEINNYISSRI